MSAFVQPYQDNTEDVGISGADKDSTFLLLDPWDVYGERRPVWLNRFVKRVVTEYPRLRRSAGLRLWIVRSEIDFKDDKVASVSATLLVEGKNEWLGGTWKLLPTMPEHRLRFYAEQGLFRPDMNLYLVHWAHLHMGDESGEVLYNYVSPASSGEQVHAATAFSDSCMTKFSGCASLCELMPDAHRYKTHHGYPSWGWNSGSWGDQEDSCH